MKQMIRVRVISRKEQGVMVPQQLWPQGMSVEDIWCFIIVTVIYYLWRWMNAIAIWEPQEGPRVPRTGAALACRRMLRPSARPAKLRLRLLLICRLCQPLMERTFPPGVGVLERGSGFLQETASSDCIPHLGVSLGKEKPEHTGFCSICRHLTPKMYMQKEKSVLRTVWKAKPGRGITPKVEVLHFSESELTHSMSSLSCVIPENIT